MYTDELKIGKLYVYGQDSNPFLQLKSGYAVIYIKSTIQDKQCKATTPHAKHHFMAPLGKIFWIDVYTLNKIIWTKDEWDRRNER